jgi:hypothetical protein
LTIIKSIINKGGETMTQVKIEATGHLGDYSAEFNIVQGREWEGLGQMIQSFLQYIIQGIRVIEEED